MPGKKYIPLLLLLPYPCPLDLLKACVRFLKTSPFFLLRETPSGDQGITHHARFFSPPRNPVIFCLHGITGTHAHHGETRLVAQMPVPTRDKNVPRRVHHYNAVHTRLHVGRGLFFFFSVGGNFDVWAGGFFGPYLAIYSDL